MASVYIHLEGGGEARIENTSTSANNIEASLRTQLAQGDARFTYSDSAGSIDVDRSKVIGWSIKK